MISTTYASKSVFLCNHEPDWSAAVENTFAIQTSAVTSKTNREEREPMAATLVSTLKYTSFLESVGTAVLRSALALWDNRPVLVPFWPAATLQIGGNSASVVGGLKVWFEPNWTSWELGTGSAPGGFSPSSLCMVAPVLYGRFGAFPTMTAITGGDDTDVKWEFVENGPASFALGPNTQTLTTTVINSQTVPVLTVQPDWGSNSAQSDVRISRGKVGFSRADAEDYIAQVPRTKEKIAFDLLNTAETLYLIALFQDRLGSVKPWQCYSVQSQSTTALARFSGDTLKIQWGSWAYGGERASAQIEVVTLPTEELVLSGETPGTNFGSTPGRWYGYSVTDGTTTWRYTSYESDTAGPGGTYTSAVISHGAITEEINLAVNDCTLEVQNFAGSPWSRTRNQLTAAPLVVTIYEGAIANPAAALPIFTGTATAPTTDGPRWKINLVGLSALLDMEGPRYILSATCLACLGDAKCGLNLSTVQVTKTLLSFVGDTYVFQTVGGLAPHRFAGGEARRTIGSVTQRYFIVDSSTSGTDLACVLASKVSPTPTGTESGWILVPGCDGSPSTCQGFSNFVNFRGAPYVPNANPAMIPLTTQASGKK